MGRLFGTDGIRGTANQEPMTPETALKAGKAIARFFLEKNEGGGHDGIIVGRDTRISGPMLESALVSGICSMGVDTHLVGVLPTPGIAYTVLSRHAHAGIVISASHNPYDDNGIKIFGPDGYKLSDENEMEIEQLILGDDNARLNNGIKKTGRVYGIEHPIDAYVDFLKRTLPDDFSLLKKKIILDCANGAACQTAPTLFHMLGADVEAMFVRPDGENINAGCGSEHPDSLQKRVVEQQAVAGFAFDGDGDRLVAVDENGTALSGDQVIAICANHLKRQSKLKRNTVVTTVMSNMGLSAALTRIGASHAIAGVGDRYVMEKMKSTGASLGGEDSGHIIFSGHHTTGDGLLAALQLLVAMTDEAKPLSELATLMTIFPQKLINVDVQTKPDLNTIPAVREAIKNAETILGEYGRVLVRYSGTQNICRVMVEGPTEGETTDLCESIASVVKQQLA